ncbi:AbrB/MazE/SpoVT family DNA-binding domain-containing protein [Alteribacter keqinensis]|uniref:AbrB/MazE/SpoVT family DNA-binding domain-containing protein n=1 Tax=Alteribacter keqinensis TaxID=2483800 RepID=A0A3M7TYJ7_9BACI|nr:AbrB/MazE/SpoVT family DNA-binding domain-containing protein [Alteribacter keqinensis]RNA69495.1 AbrB/MazE/SpoVT family DNA-binding domain-containing protein [Alteribacter keqinensis]
MSYIITLWEGRIVIPKELRRILDINIKDPVEIFTDNEKIILQKYKANMTCDVTSEITDNNESFLDGKLVLSPKGKNALVNEITLSLPSFYKLL